VDSVVARRAGQVASDDVGQPFESGRYRPERFSLGARCRRPVLTDWMCWRVGGRGRPRWWVGRFAEWLGVAARRGGFDRVEAYGAGVGPAQPVLRFAVHVVRRRAVIAVVTMIEDAAMHPRHTAPVHRGQRLPQLVVQQHAAKATAAVHPVAPEYTVDVNRLDPGILTGRTPRVMGVILALVAPDVSLRPTDCPDLHTCTDPCRVAVKKDTSLRRALDDIA
jgi:hypothetical protein